MTIFSWFSHNKTMQINESDKTSTGNRLSKDSQKPLNKRGSSMWPVAKVTLVGSVSLPKRSASSDTVTAVNPASKTIDDELVNEKYVVND
ncbi:hypothetical protein [Thalassotalea mangrovi]|uniref:Uncharacterized protein n=1 Tax=Thalassotalea mangrovi TaxID=2572245 RepID=A0A4U1B3I7_9GAMM|nr:hypothetical protein [Thalassotalea mangrovi]TKB44403.1 hypothetical protein E8M12_12175 [Thalassotalea mangrovi]